MTIWEVDDDDKTIEGLDEDGRPDPAYAAALGLVPAPLLRRAVAAIIDAALYLVLQVPYWVFTLPLLLKYFTARISWYGLINHPQFILAVVMMGISFLLSLAYCIVQIALHGRKGFTFGKSMLGLRSINVKTLERPGFFRILLRSLVIWLSGLVVIGPILFLLSPLFDPEKRGRGWHDMVGRSWMVDVRKGLQPYDAKRIRIARKTVMAEPVARPKPMPSLATPADASQEQAYRPGARVSAGVLGIARPHGEGPRPVVGLSGAEEPEPAPEPTAAPVPGRPVMGAYRRSASGEDHPSAPVGSGRPDLSTGPAQAAPPDGVGSPAPAPAPAPAPDEPMVTGVPWTSGQASSRPGQGETPAPAGPAAVESSSEAARNQGAPPAQAAAPPAAAGPVPAQAQAHPPHGPPVPPSPAGAVGFALVIDSGARVVISGDVVLGRNPAPPATAPGAQVHPIPDDTRSVSKTHVLVRAVEHGVTVMDQGSTNGTSIVHNGVERELQPGQPGLAVIGDTIRFGERTAVVARA
ncbi:RDD family protein [Ruania alba]|uniref:Uncharacterized membrane protein YckC, RDD family n=1 Tax=Ruania alba TaxID=648782 RepID=A0A1H5MNC6_9MICO|nr:RDD family protein [Ruania alba]SEE90227.1 Uncharacterized membrane protein YckC, RDD family [Ruania alba]